MDLYHIIKKIKILDTAALKVHKLAESVQSRCFAVYWNIYLSSIILVLYAKVRIVIIGAELITSNLTNLDQSKLFARIPVK